MIFKWDSQMGKEKDMEPYVDPVFENNVILTETERLMCWADRKSQSM
jgi:hypothetical protein